MATDPSERLNWTNTLFLVGAHLMAVVAVLYLVYVKFSWWTIGLGCLWMFLCSISISAGYHRLFAHRTYKAAEWWRGLLLLFGAASVQNSALLWSADHRRHHSFVDTDRDPYNVKRGFWWSHVGWVLHSSDEPRVAGGLKDLESDRLVQWQHRYYPWIALVVAGLIPLGLGFLWGDPIGAFLVAAFLRLVLQWHSTFTINSLAHIVGTQPYTTANSARDSWLIALISWGEGYHNFHHRFQADYRNGVRWWQFDPTKWILWSLEKVRVVSNLRRTPDTAIRRALQNPG